MRSWRDRQKPRRQPLLTWGEFTSHVGLQLPYKLECDVLTDRDWECVAQMIASEFTFHEVEGVPNGGLKLAAKLYPLVSEHDPKFGEPILLIVDDVLTTGYSVEHHRAGRDALGIVLFARGQCPDWVVPIFQMDQTWWPT